MPRSGTSLTGALLNQSDDIAVYNEVDISLFPALKDLMRQYRKWGEDMMASPHERWRGMTVGQIEQGAYGIFEAFCTALKPVVPDGQQRWDVLPKSRARTYCLKSPRAELESETYDSLFPTSKPKYIYCLRDPVKLYASLLSMPWGHTTMPEDFCARLRHSIDQILHLLDERPARAFVFNIDKASRSESVRHQLGQALFEFIGLPISEPVDRFLGEWPATNRAKDKFGNQEFLSAEDRAARSAQLLAMISADAKLSEAIPRLLS